MRREKKSAIEIGAEKKKPQIKTIIYHCYIDLDLRSFSQFRTAALFICIDN